ncbi:alpha/beta hydrolase [Sagittula sp.]|uniref:alpha/beta hydrolase n=1 Tax=Sagittula sp. TaxID=2038081 RepID=UPI00351696B9
MKPHPVFDGTRLKATVFRPRRKKLFVSFRQRVGDPGSFDTPRPVMGFVTRSFAHVHIQSRDNDWFINDETEALEAALARFVGRYDEVVAMGFSMGGYGALRFARTLKVDRLLAISPQVSIDPDVVPFDRRYRAEAEGWNGALGNLEGRTTEARGAVLVDPFKNRDVEHGRMICALFPQLTLVMLPCGGHPATRAIRQGGRFDWLKTGLAEGLADPREIGRVHRMVRRRSESYWRNLAQVARYRGREGLAQRADAEAEALTERA